MRVLVVDDDLTSRLLAEAMVVAAGHRCVQAADGAAAWQVLAEGGVDVVISDRIQPGMDGLELCRRIRADLPAYVYVILATGLGDHQQARDGMLAGADDYLVKPLDPDELALRLIAAERVSALHRQLDELHAASEHAARQDPLTGLGNRLRLQEDLRALAERSSRYGHRYCVALLDVDHFKDFNDRRGHLAGDRALQGIADALTNSSRAGDAVYRYGGEEFLCVFPEQDAGQALAAVERMRSAVAALRPDRLTVSAGLAEMIPGRPMQEVLQRADEALYRAKARGRNLVVPA